jgi:hypothetical protein
MQTSGPSKEKRSGENDKKNGREIACFGPGSNDSFPNKIDRPVRLVGLLLQSWIS